MNLKQSRWRHRGLGAKRLHSTPGPGGHTQRNTSIHRRYCRAPDPDAGDTGAGCRSPTSQVGPHIAPLLRLRNIRRLTRSVTCLSASSPRGRLVNLDGYVYSLPAGFEAAPIPVGTARTSAQSRPAAAPTGGGMTRHCQRACGQGRSHSRARASSRRRRRSLRSRTFWRTTGITPSSPAASLSRSRKPSSPPTAG